MGCVQQEGSAPEAQTEKAKLFIVAAKQRLSSAGFQVFTKALRAYKASDDFQALGTHLCSLFGKDSEKHNLFRGAMGPAKWWVEEPGAEPALLRFPLRRLLPVRASPSQAVL